MIRAVQLLRSNEPHISCGVRSMVPHSESFDGLISVKGPGECRGIITIHHESFNSQRVQFRVHVEYLRKGCDFINGRQIILR
jgi:hypothetical protein